mgnify:CR=1 FL=1
MGPGARRDAGGYEPQTFPGARLPHFPVAKATASGARRLSSIDVVGDLARPRMTLFVPDDWADAGAARWRAAARAAIALRAGRQADRQTAWRANGYDGSAAAEQVRSWLADDDVDGADDDARAAAAAARRGLRKPPVESVQPLLTRTPYC